MNLKRNKSQSYYWWQCVLQKVLTAEPAVGFQDRLISLLKLGGLWNRSLISVFIFDVVFKATTLILFSSDFNSSGDLPCRASLNFLMYP